MSSADSVSEATVIDDVDEVEIKVEYPEVEVEEENRTNFSPFENTRKIQHQSMMLDPAYNLWTSKATSCLISNYKKYRSMVGQTTKFRSLRDMFETISIEMQKHGFYFSPQKCENKWRVLERKYKNLEIREMLKKPGRIKHYGHWEHKRALDEIFHEKRKSVYLKENEYPVGSSTKYSLILPKSVSEQNIRVDREIIQTLRKDFDILPSGILSTEKDKDSTKLSNTPIPTANSEDSSKKPSFINFEKFLLEMKKCFDTVEKNKERRHAEKMVILRNKLKVQERLLKLKEQKLELEKRKIIAMAQNIQLNMQ